ncbi:MAG: hypothetical protein PHO30_07355, partial [Candidatus Omnitrophica bacterium]|nr:hypothetical protein [Candidatus Omnitrophota bacterium]
DGKKVSKAEAVLIERNWEQSGGVKDISLAYGIQDRLFGEEANQALTAKISGMESGAGTISPETAAALFETTPTTVESGIEDFKAAGKGEPQNQAAVYRSSGDNFKKAAESWEKAAQISPVLTPLAAAAYFNSALAYVRAGTDEDVVKAQSSFDKFSTIMKQLISEAGASFAPAQLQDAYLRYSGKPAGEILRETSMEPNAQAGVSGKVLFTAPDGRSAMGAVNGTVRTNNAGEEELVLSSPDKPGQEIILPIAVNSVDSDTLDQVKAKLIEQFGSRQASASLSDSDREIAGKIIAGIGAEGADVRIIADNAQNIFGYAQSGTGIFIAQSLLESAEQTDKSQGTLVSAMGIFLASGELATTHIELYGCGKDVRNAVSTIDMSTMKTPEQFISAINAKMPAGKQVTGEEAALIEKNWKSASDADNSGAILGLQDRLFGKEANTRFETVLKSVATKPRQNDSLIEEVGLDASKKTELQVALLDGLTQVTERTTKDMVKTLEQGGVAGLKSL